MENKKSKFPALPMILSLVFAIAARISGIVFSFLATDVLYMDSIFVYILPPLRQTLTSLSFAAAATAAFICIIRKRKCPPAILLYVAILIADTTTVLLYDFFNGVLEKRLLFAILYRYVLVIYSVGVLLIGFAIAKYMVKHKKSLLFAAIIIAVMPSVIDLASVLYSSISSLIEWEFLPYTSEVYSILTDIGTAILACVLSGVIAIVFTKREPSYKLSEKRSV